VNHDLYDQTWYWFFWSKDRINSSQNTLNHSFVTTPSLISLSMLISLKIMFVEMELLDSVQRNQVNQWNHQFRKHYRLALSVNRFILRLSWKIHGIKLKYCKYCKYRKYTLYVMLTAVQIYIQSRDKPIYGQN
jgi:hypothetical protein